MGLKKSPSSHKFTFFTDSHLAQSNTDDESRERDTTVSAFYALTLNTSELVLDQEEEGANQMWNVRPLTVSTRRRHNVKVLPIFSDKPNEEGLKLAVKAHAERHNLTADGQRFLNSLFNLEPSEKELTEQDSEDKRVE